MITTPIGSPPLAPLFRAFNQGTCVSLEKDIAGILDSALSLKGRGHAFKRDTRLLGAVPELDSMAVLAVISSLEERFALLIRDDEIDSATFESLGTLIDFVASKLDLA